jgi:hypothetical protein
MRKCSLLGRFLLTGAMALGVMTGTHAAHAATYEFIAGNPIFVNNLYTAVNNSFGAGIFNSTLKKNGVVFATGSVCSETTENYRSSVPGDNINIRTVTSTTNAKRFAVARLLDSWLPTLKANTANMTLGSTNYTATALNSGFQQAIWTLFVGSPPTYVSNVALANQARDYFLGIANNSVYSSSTAVIVYDTDPGPPNFQNQLMVTNHPIPEPAFYQMAGLLGLGSVVWVRKRKRTRESDPS